jgi:hypothetical protein
MAAVTEPAVAHSSDLALQEANRARATPARKGWYEVYYATVSLPGERAAWLRWTLSSPRRGQPTAAVWAVAFDRERPRWFAGRDESPGSAWVPLPRGGVRIGDAEVSPEGCRGEAGDAAGRRMRWDLRWRPLAPPIAFFPAALERLARSATYPIAAMPLGRATGHIQVEGEVLECTDVAVEQSHLFGGRHANRWGWVHALGFDDDPNGYLALIWARPQRLGGYTPPASSIALRVGDTELRSKGIRGMRRVLWSDGGGEVVRFTALIDDVDIEGEIRAPLRLLTGVTYHDPSDGEVFCANTEVADLTVRLRRGDGASQTWRCHAACGFERGARIPFEGIWRAL